MSRRSESSELGEGTALPTPVSFRDEDISAASSLLKDAPSTNLNKSYYIFITADVKWGATQLSSVDYTGYTNDTCAI
jgi:hypothetical protein